MDLFRQEQILSGPPKRRKYRLLLLLVVAFLLFGSLYPQYSASRLPRHSGAIAEAIFVLAGGDKRIVVGVKALKDGIGRELYILGTGHSAVPETVIPGYAGLSEDERRRIHLEGWSETTLENAVSAKTIVGERQYRSVVLVTSDYHLPRAYLAVRSAIPETVRIEVLTVNSRWTGSDARWRKIRLFFVESWKYWGYRLLLQWE